MQINGDGGVDLQSEINITPLVDVVLVLLIIFMVIVPLTMRGYDVDIPRATATATPLEDEARQVVLGIDAETCPVTEPPREEGLPTECSVRINDERVSLAELGPRVAEIFNPRAVSDRVLFLSAQDRLNYEGVMRIVDIAKSSVDGLRIGLVTEG